MFVLTQLLCLEMILLVFQSLQQGSGVWVLPALRCARWATASLPTARSITEVALRVPRHIQD